jgi:8-oxo-dGTP pyrophosphatase MutT (NUDIX family)
MCPWLQLGGHADGDNDILRVALKEASEESGISSIKDISEEIFDIDVHQIPANKNEKAHIHYDIRFILQVSSDEKIKINHESNE